MRARISWIILKNALLLLAACVRQGRVNLTFEQASTVVAGNDFAVTMVSKTTLRFQGCSNLSSCMLGWGGWRRSTSCCRKLCHLFGDVMDLVVRWSVSCYEGRSCWELKKKMGTRSGLIERYANTAPSFTHWQYKKDWKIRGCICLCNSSLLVTQPVSILKPPNKHVTRNPSVYYSPQINT